MVQMCEVFAIIAFSSSNRLLDLQAPNAKAPTLILRSPKNSKLQAPSTRTHSVYIYRTYVWIHVCAENKKKKTMENEIG